ncbi:hypothetical protein G6F36_015900 [Rhizopus arrhizus]|nr:hypothetical protein G6F36_015900 [Rhizopus arrhizus]
MARWLADRSLTVLNGPLAHGIPTWVGFRDDREMSSIIDMFLTNASLMSPRLDIASDLSLGSDHRLLTLSFSFAQSSASEPSSATTDFTLHPPVSRYLSFVLCSLAVSTEEVGSTPSFFTSAY